MYMYMYIYIYIHVCVYMCWNFWLIINVNFLGLEFLISIRHDLCEVAIATAEDGEEVAHEDLLKTWMVQLNKIRMWPIKIH